MNQPLIDVNSYKRTGPASRSPKSAMSIREKIINNGRTSTVVALLVIVGAGVAIFLQSRDTSKPVAMDQAQAFYTDDDGATWFTGPAQTIVPYIRDGKEVLRAFVFKPESGGEPFCGYLQRFSKAGLIELARAQKAHDAGERAVKASPGGGASGNYTLPAVPFEDVRLQEVKPPRSAAPWVGYTSGKGHAVVTVKSPDGSAAVPMGR